MDRRSEAHRLSGAEGDGLGRSVSLSEDVAVIGTPWTDDGSGYVFDLGPKPFLRGDVDGNGTVSVLVDALLLLNWGFSNEPGEAAEFTIPCHDAADVDDNGTVFTLIDALALLNWGFDDGEEPPDPGPTDCGLDPTPVDGLNCQEEFEFCRD